MNFYMKHSYAKELVDTNGWNEFINYWRKTYPSLKLYSCSTSWYNNEEYICKLKGTCGDIVIEWN